MGLISLTCLSARTVECGGRWTARETNRSPSYSPRSFTTFISHLLHILYYLTLIKSSLTITILQHGRGRKLNAVERHVPCTTLLLIVQPTEGQRYIHVSLSNPRATFFNSSNVDFTAARRTDSSARRSWSSREVTSTHIG